MKKRINKNDFIKQLSKTIFWDLKIDKLDYKNDKQTIIYSKNNENNLN